MFKTGWKHIVRRRKPDKAVRHKVNRKVHDEFIVANYNKMTKSALASLLKIPRGSVISRYHINCGCRKKKAP